MNPISHQLITQPFHDAIVVNDPYSVVEYNTILDPSSAGERAGGHQDAIQLIPVRRDGTQNTQYALAHLHSVGVTNNHFYSCAQLQLLFSSDGLLSELVVQNNVLVTASAHFISLGGVLGDCYFRNNYTTNGDLCPIVFSPARVGGNQKVNGVPTGNTWIIGFKKGSPYRYGAVSEMVADKTLDHVIDNRFGHARPRPGDTYLNNFDVDRFTEAAGKKQLTPPQMQFLAWEYGDKVYTT